MFCPVLVPNLPSHSPCRGGFRLCTFQPIVNNGFRRRLQPLRGRRLQSHAAPVVAVPRTHSDANLAIRHAAPMAHVLAAIYLEGAGLGGGLLVIAANRKSDCSQCSISSNSNAALRYPAARSDSQSWRMACMPCTAGPFRRQNDRTIAYTDPDISGREFP
jgi:hypothetical protein